MLVYDLRYGARRGRGERRDHTQRYARKGLTFWLSFGYKDRNVGEFAKCKALSCRCTRKHGSPKVAYGCTYGGFCYNPALMERVEGNRLARAWLAYARDGWDLDDVEI